MTCTWFCQKTPIKIHAIRICKQPNMFYLSHKMVVNQTRWLYCFPSTLQFQNGTSQNEFFVTFEEPNIFDNPWTSLWLKMAATITWLIGFCCSSFIYTYVIYEIKGYAASFRTVINQLVTWCYFVVSIKSSFV